MDVKILVSEITVQKVENNKNKDELPNCFISSPFDGVYGRFNMYENKKEDKIYKNFSLQIYNGKQFKTKKQVPYTSMLMTITGIKKLKEELEKAIAIYEANITQNIEPSKNM